MVLNLTRQPAGSTALDDGPASAEAAASAHALRVQVEELEQRVRQAEDRRRAMLHIMGDLSESNRRLSDQRRAMLHILMDYERDRRQLVDQAQRLDNSRRALLHILQDSHRTNLRLEESRKAMIHIMGDLRDTTAEMESRQKELRDKQEQLVQAAKLATLGELTTGVAHELNNPLNNIGLFVGNVVDYLELSRDGSAATGADGDECDDGAGGVDRERMVSDLERALQQVHKATEIISHLRTFGRATPITREPVAINKVVEESLSLMQEQLRLRQIRLELRLSADEPRVLANAIHLEQILINLLTNARDAMAESPRKVITISTAADGDVVRLLFADSGTGIPAGLEQRIFDPFFTTKEVGQATGLGLSITYGLIKELNGNIAVANAPDGGAVFTIQLPRASGDGVRP